MDTKAARGAHSRLHPDANSRVIAVPTAVARGVAACQKDGT